MDITYIDEVLIRTVLRTAIALDDKNMMLWGQRHSDGVVQLGRRCICAPIDGIDAHACGSDNGLNILDVLHRVVADGHARVGFTLRRFNMTGLQRVLWRHLIA